MDSATITIPVDSELAEAFNEASPELKQQIVEALNLKLRQVVQPENLEQVMRQISRQAQARGLTPDMLPSMLLHTDL